MTAHFPKRKTAFLVIHGIGQQVPFETLDSFALGIVGFLQFNRIPFRMTHKLSERNGAKGLPWTESFVRLSDPAGKNYLDIHEYYWAYITEEQIKPREVYRWVAQALDGAMTYAEQNEEIRKKYEGGPKPYWWRLLSIMRWMRYWHWFIRLVLFLLPKSFRYVKRSSAQLGFTRFDTTCTIEFNAAYNDRTLAFYQRVWNDLIKRSIPYTLHWGQMGNYSPKRVPAMYGKQTIKSWKEARAALLGAEMQKVFSSPFLEQCGLTH